MSSDRSSEKWTILSFPRFEGLFLRLRTETSSAIPPRMPTQNRASWPRRIHDTVE